VKSNFKGQYGTFSIDATGKWAYVANSAYDELNVGKSLSESLTVSSSDGTTTTVGITIHGTNDPAILSAPDVHVLETNEPLKLSGKIDIRDVDSPETLAPQKNVKGRNGTFNIDADGQWTYVANSAFDELNIGRSVSDAFRVYSADNTSTSVRVTIDGTNDPAVLGAPRASLKETNSKLRTTGTVSIYDVDSPEVFKEQRNVRGKTGTFSLDAKGNWTYVSNSAYDWLGLDQSVSDSFTLESDDGTKSTVSVIINGTNDSASLSSTKVTLFETNSPRFTGGRIYNVDVDSPMLFVAQSNVNGKYGSFSLDPSGRWSYDAFSAFNELEVGQSISDRFLVISRDGTPTSVQITIEGTEESKFDGGWVGAKAGINRSNLGGMKARNALAYGIEEGTSWKVGTLQFGIYGSLEFNNTASGPVNYGSTTFGMGAKLGYPYRNWFPYGKLGYARTNGSDAAVYIGAGHMYRAVGVEYKMDDNLSLSAEYTKSNGSTIFDGIDYQLFNRNFTIGINFYFGVLEPNKPVPTPIVAPKAQSSVPMNEIDYESTPLATPESAPSTAPAFGPAPAPKTSPEVTPAFGPAPPQAPPAEITPSFGPVPAPKASDDAPITPSF
ncbi:MAG: VCBS domain-containing protein, partial [Gallionella sp.]